MKRKEVLETEKLNEVAPLVAALMGALVGAGLSRSQAQRAAQQAAQDPAVAQATGGTPAASRPTTGGNYEDTMRTGSRGEGVRQLQQALGMQQVDGIFGPNTERAVRQFQQSQGLQVDGIVGPETRARIERMASDDQDGAAPTAAEPAAEPAAAGPNLDQRDAERERAAAAAPNNGAPQANPNRQAGAPSRLQIRQRIAPEMERLLQLASKDFRGYKAIIEGKSLAEALEAPQKAQLQQLLNQVRAAAQNDPQVNTEFADLIARAQRALGIGTTNPNDTTGQPDLSPDGPNAAPRPATGDSAADVAQDDAARPAPTPGTPTNPIRYPNQAAAIRAHGPNLISARPGVTRLPANSVMITIAGQPFIAPAARATPAQAPAMPTQAGVAAESKKMNKKTVTEASVNINGTAEEIAELMRMMQLAGAPGAKPVGIDDINPGPKPCPTCGKIHGPMPKPGGCGGAPMQGPEGPDMGDMIRMISKEEENEDGGFGDATTEPSDTYMGSNAGDVSDIIPDGNDLHKEKDAYPAVNGGDNAMRIKEQLYRALAEKKNKKKKPDADGDGVPDWADKKPGKDDHADKKKGSKPKKGEVPPQFKKK
jgi:peptidoglycan hydrolase-like protein with peptidoglycan-binding domain